MSEKAAINYSQTDCRTVSEGSRHGQVTRGPGPATHEAAPCILYSVSRRDLIL